MYTGPDFGHHCACKCRARPSAGTVLTKKLHMFSFKFGWLSMITWHVYGPMMSSKMAAEIPLNLVALRVLRILCSPQVPSSFYFRHSRTSVRSPCPRNGCNLPRFHHSESQKTPLKSLGMSCGDTCQIWKWFNGFKRYRKIRNVLKKSMDGVTITCIPVSWACAAHWQKRTKYLDISTRDMMPPQGHHVYIRNIISAHSTWQ